MLNARLKIKMGKEFLERISMQHILNCSFYSQVNIYNYTLQEINHFLRDVKEDIPMK